VAEVGLLVRPHPANARQWRTFDGSALDNVVIWPPVGADPNDPDARGDYRDSIHHSAAVVGINTSAEIEAAIVGRPVLTVRAPEFVHAQEGTLHFEHLVNAERGFVRQATTLDEHVRHLGAALESGADVETRRRFLESFLRPHGLDVPVTPRFVREIERLARLPGPMPHHDSWRVRAVRPVAYLCARLARPIVAARSPWEIGLRPLVSAAVWSAAAAYRVRDAWRHGGRLAFKHGGRAAQRTWHASSRAVGRRLRRARKPISAVMRGAVRRLAGRNA
jgi:hypothetical protein